MANPREEAGLDEARLGGRHAPFAGQRRQGRGIGHVDEIEEEAAQAERDQPGPLARLHFLAVIKAHQPDPSLPHRGTPNRLHFLANRHLRPIQPIVNDINFAIQPPPRIARTRMPIPVPAQRERNQPEPGLGIGHTAAYLW